MELSPETQLRTLQLLRAIWNEVDSPAAVGTSPDASQQSLLYAEALARRLGLIPGSGTGMATVTFSIGTDGRDYSTITAWAADVDNGALYSGGDVARGECYDDSAFDEYSLLDGGGTVGLSGVILTAASGERHDGTAGSGARIVNSAGFAGHVIDMNCPAPTVEWLEIDSGGQSNQGCVSNSGSSGGIVIRNMLLHDTSRVAGSTVMLQGAAIGQSVTITNNIIYDGARQDSGTVEGLSTVNTSNGANCYIVNNTIHNIYNSLGNGTGYNWRDTNGVQVKNNIATGITTGFAGTTSSAVASHNLSSDATATGSGSLTNKSAGDQFVSIVGGSEDLHLKAGADAIGAGTDLGTTPAGVEVDIDGRDRDAEGDTWDIGADQYVAAGGGGAAMSLVNGGLVNAGLVNRGLC